MSLSKKHSLHKSLTMAICGRLLLILFLLCAGGGYLLYMLLPMLGYHGLLPEPLLLPLFLGGLCVFTFLLSLLAVHGVLFRIFEPLNRIRQAADAMAQGKLNFNVSYSHEDELGALCESLRKTSASMKDALEEFSHTLDKMSKGDFPLNPAPPEPAGDFTPLQAAVESVTASLHQVFLDIDAASRLVMDGSFQVANNSTALSAGVFSQRAAVETLGNSVKLLRAQTAKNTTQAAAIRRLATDCRNNAQQSQQHMIKLRSSLEEVGRVVSDMAPALESMKTLSDQIGALSLNAVVNYGKRGRIGKEFAQVASNICTLSDRSAEIAMEVLQLLERSESAVARGEHMAGHTAQVLRVVADKTEQTTQAAARVGYASATQSHTIELAAKHVAEISDVVRSNAAIAEQNTAFSEELAGQSQLLSQLVTHFYAQGAVPIKQEQKYNGKQRRRPNP